MHQISAGASECWKNTGIVAFTFAMQRTAMGRTRFGDDSAIKTEFVVHSRAFFSDSETQHHGMRELNDDHMLLQRHVARSAMEKEGLLRAYSSDKVSPAVERWRSDRGQRIVKLFPRLMLRFHNSSKNSKKRPSSFHGETTRGVGRVSHGNQAGCDLLREDGQGRPPWLTRPPQRFAHQIGRTVKIRQTDR
jgi:hypothetical protein